MAEGWTEGDAVEGLVDEESGWRGYSVVDIVRLCSGGGDGWRWPRFRAG